MATSGTSTWAHHTVALYQQHALAMLAISIPRSARKSAFLSRQIVTNDDLLSV